MGRRWFRTQKGWKTRGPCVSWAMDSLRGVFGALCVYTGTRLADDRAYHCVHLTSALRATRLSLARPNPRTSIATPVEGRRRPMGVTVKLILISALETSRDT
eukprot:1045581-Prymnesium_polylepis.1